MSEIRDRMRKILDSAKSDNPGAILPTWQIFSNQGDRFYTITNIKKENLPSLLNKGVTSCNSFAIWVLSQMFIDKDEALKQNLIYGKLKNYGKRFECWEERSPDSPNLPECGDLFNPAHEPHHVGFCYEIHEDTKVLQNGRLIRVEWTKVEGGQNNDKIYDSVWKFRKQLDLHLLLGWFNIEKYINAIGDDKWRRQ